MRLAYTGADRDLQRSPETTQALARWANATFPTVTIGSSYRPWDDFRDHREGALDIMTGDRSVHDQICDALIRLHNQGACVIVSLISWGRRWTPGQGWHPYRGDNPHTDHVHAWLRSSGGFRGEGAGAGPAPARYPLTGQRRAGKPCYYGNRRGPANWVGGYHAKDRPGIRQIQARLRQCGHQIAIDGIYGPQTEAAVRAYQAGHGLTADGLVGPATWASLMD